MTRQNTIGYSRPHVIALQAPPIDFSFSVEKIPNPYDIMISVTQALIHYLVG